jgi:hypothetical protein
MVNSMSLFLYLCGFSSHLFTVFTLLFLCALYLLTINPPYLQNLLQSQAQQRVKSCLEALDGSFKAKFCKMGYEPGRALWPEEEKG